MQTLELKAIRRTSIRYELEADQVVADTLYGHAEAHESAWIILHKA